MKSILYVGATLMIGASIYGFVGYKKSAQKKEFTRMYESPEVKEPVIATEKIAPAVAEIVPAVTTTKKAEVKTKSVSMKSKIAIAAAEKMESAPVLVTTPVKETASAKKFKQVRKKKLNYKLFSRAPLREEREIVVLPEPAKKDASKTEIKGQ
jgi:hypothetical protein